MDFSRLIKLNQKLLAGTAVLGLGAVASGAIGGAVAGGVSSVVLSMIADNLGALGKNLKQSQSVLRNEDLAKAAGRTVGNTLRETISPRYPEIRGSLNDLADRIEAYWVEWAEQAQDLNIFESVQEQHLYKLFATSPETFTETAVLSLEDWRSLVIWLFDQGHQKQVIMSVDNYQDVIEVLAKELQQNFSKNLRQVLKADAEKGGKAFAGMLLDLHSATLAKIDKIREQLPNLATKEDICQQLRQLETGIQDELAQIREALCQYVDQSKPQLPLPQNCESLIAEKTQDFVGRRYVFQAIKDFLQQKPKGYFILEADPGVGKSAIMARCVQSLQGYVPTHFNIQAQGITKVDQFLENICTQLINGYQLDYAGLPENTKRDGNVLAQMLADASKRLLPGKKLVIVVDALDEVDLSSQTPGSNVLYLPDALPNNVYFIVSKRPQPLPMPLSDYQTTFDLMQYPAESALDARRYIIKRWQNSPQIQQWVATRNSTPDTFFTELVEKSENNFMYLRYVLNDIRDGLYQGETLDSLPRGLQRYYQKHWHLMGMNTDPIPVDKIRIIYVLSEVREAVSRRLLAKLVGVKENELRPVLNRWQQFLRQHMVDQELRYAIYHASFSDFLNLQAIESGVDLEDINRRIADNLTDGAPL